MHRLSFALLFAAACGDAEAPMTAPDASPSPIDAVDETPSIIGEAGFAERITLAGDCLAISRGGMIVCVPTRGGAPKEILNLPGRQIVEPLGDGDGILFTHRGLPDTPDARDLRISRVTLGGAVAHLGKVDAAPDAGEGLAIAGDRIVFSHGGSAAISTLPRDGGVMSMIVSDGGNIADLTVLRDTVYFINSPGLRTQPVTGTLGRGTQIANFAHNTRLATDGARVVAAGTRVGANGSAIRVFPDGPEIVLEHTVGVQRIAAADNTAWVIVDDDILEVDLTSGTFSFLVRNTPARDLVIGSTHVYWTDSAGTIRALPR